MVHRSRGGPTELTNLVLLCTFYHHVVHEGDWNVIARADGNFGFERPNGKPATIRYSSGSVSAVYQPSSQPMSATTFQPRSFTPNPNLSWITAVVDHNEALHREQDVDTG